MNKPGERAITVEDLIGRLDSAVEHEDAAVVCESVKRVLIETAEDGVAFLGPEFLEPTPGETYARRLLHRDPRGRYTVVVMVWAPGQATNIHDHAGIWCVECVYRGAVEVTSYRCEELARPDRYMLTEESVIDSGVGDAGALNPPFEYHKIENRSGRPAVTIHVYGGELTWCHAFYPAADGGFRREKHTFGYA
jgi:predicted metal-dependent enzyme (double-stranded beta helix superfamily)